MRKASVTWLGALAVVGLGLRVATGQPALAAENLRLCTGSPGKAYIKVGQKLADLAPRLTAGAQVTVTNAEEAPPAGAEPAAPQSDRRRGRGNRREQRSEAGSPSQSR